MSNNGIINNLHLQKNVCGLRNKKLVEQRIHSKWIIPVAAGQRVSSSLVWNETRMGTLSFERTQGRLNTAKTRKLFKQLFIQ